MPGETTLVQGLGPDIQRKISNFLDLDSLVSLKQVNAEINNVTSKASVWKAHHEVLGGPKKIVQLDEERIFKVLNEKETILTKRALLKTRAKKLAELFSPQNLSSCQKLTNLFFKPVPLSTSLKENVFKDLEIDFAMNVIQEAIEHENLNLPKNKYYFLDVVQSSQSVEFFAEFAKRFNSHIDFTDLMFAKAAPEVLSAYLETRQIMSANDFWRLEEQMDWIFFINDINPAWEKVLKLSVEKGMNLWAIKEYLPEYYLEHQNMFDKLSIT